MTPQTTPRPRQVLMLMPPPASMVFSDNPLVPPREGIAVDAGLRFADLQPRTTLPLVLKVNGEYLLRADWELVVEPGDVIEWHGLPQGGGGSRGILNAILIVALVVAVVGFGLDPGSALKIYAIGSALINLLVPIKTPQQNQLASPSSVYNVQVAGNQARLNQPIPVIYGRMLTYPDFAAQPYGEYINNDQYYHAIFCIGQGNFAIERLQIGNSPLSSFQDVTYAILPPGSLPTLVKTSVVNAPEAAGQDIKQGIVVGGFSVCGPGLMVSAVGVDVVFQTGLARADSAGNLSSVTATFRIDAQQLDGFGVAVGDWYTLGSPSVTRTTITPVRVSYKYTLAAAARVQVRITRLDTFEDKANVQNSPVLGGIRGYLAFGATTRARRVFAWYEATTGVSSQAYAQDEYASANELAGSLQYYTSPPAAAYWADVRPSSGVAASSPVVYVDASGNPAPVVPAPNPLGSVVWDAASSNFFSLGPEYVVSSTQKQDEYRIGATGALISTTTIDAVMVDQVGATPKVLIFFNAAWRAWGYSASTNKYATRDAATPVWTKSTTWFGGSATSRQTYGAVIIGSTLVVLLLDGATATNYVTFAKSTDGTTWTASTDNDVTGGLAGTQIDRSSGNGNIAIRVGSLVGVYVRRSTGPFVILSAADFTGAATISALTLDGGAVPAGTTMSDFIGTAAGGYVLCTVVTLTGSAYASRLAVSTNGIAFTTVSNASLLATVDGRAVTQAGQYNRPLISSGTKFLYERTMTEQVPASLVAPLSATATHLELRIRATAQLSQFAQNRISVIARRKLRTWSPAGGGTWSAEVETRSIAWALADVWTNATYGDGLADSRVDLQTLYDLDAVWTARQDRLDVVFDSKITSWDAATTIAQAGRAKPFRRAGVCTLWRDQAQTLPVTAFTSRNMLPGLDIGYSLATEITADGVIVEYFYNRTWQWESVTCPAPGVVRPVNAPRVRLLGITGLQQAKRQGYYLAAQNVYRRKLPKWQTELTGLLPAYGSLVLYAPDLPGAGQAGDVVDFNPVTLVMSLSEPAVFTAGAASHYISLMRDDGSVTSAIAALPGPTENDVVLASAPDFYLVLDDANRERPKYIFGVSGEHRVPVVVLGIQKRGKDESGAQLIEITGVAEDDRVHTVDNAFLPGPGTVQDPVDSSAIPISGGGSGGGTIPILTAQSIAVTDGSEFGGGGSKAGRRFKNDGTSESISATLGDTLLAGQWLLSPNATDAALYEVRATDTYAWGCITGSALNTWLSLGTTRAWVIDTTVSGIELPGGVPDKIVVSLGIEIRKIATPGLTLASFYDSLQVNI